MPPHHSHFKQKVKQLNADYVRYKSNKRGAEEKVDKSFQNVLNELERHWSGSLDTLIRDARQAILPHPDQFSAEFHGSRDVILELEARLLRATKQERKRLRRYYNEYRRRRAVCMEYPRNFKELRLYLTTLHQRTKAAIEATRGMKPIGAKNARRAEIVEGFTAYLDGTVILVADTTHPDMDVYSYALGGNAIHMSRWLHLN